MNIRKTLMGCALALALATGGTAAPALAADPNPIEAASGKGMYTPEDRLTARVQICFAALKGGVGPDALRSAMAAKGFDADSQARTMEVCEVLVTGIAVGQASAAEDQPSRT